MFMYSLKSVFSVDFAPIKDDIFHAAIPELFLSKPINYNYDTKFILMTWGNYLNLVNINEFL